jgi:hypothetical protein
VLRAEEELAPLRRARLDARLAAQRLQQVHGYLLRVVEGIPP